MTSTWARRLAAATWVAALLVLPERVSAQRARELGVHSVFTGQDAELVGGGVYAGVRTTRRTRIALTAAVGSAAGELVTRGELLGHFLLSPASRGLGFYAGGGIAGLAGAGEEGFLVLLVGLESAPGGSSGWYLEGGLGGGVRVAAGWRWRWFRGQSGTG